MISSLRQRILLWAALPTAVILAAFSAYDYVTASRPATLAYDQALLSTALAISPYVVREGGRSHLNLPAAVEDALRTDGFDRLYFSVRTLDGSWIAGDRALLPDGVAVDDSPAYIDATYRGQAVRLAIVQLPTAAGELMFVVGETRNKREAMKHELVRSLVATNLLLIAAVGVAVLLGVRRGLQPLAVLRAQLMARSHLDLRPLAANDTPAELRPILDEINSLLGRLASALATQNRFVANAAHQLRTPLTGLSLHVERALADPDPANVHDALTHIRRLTQRAARTTAQLLALTRAQAPSTDTVEHVPLELTRLIPEAVMQRVHESLAAGVDLGYQGPEQTLSIDGHAASLHDLLDNLIDNSIRYAGRGSTVTVSLQAQPDGGASLLVEDNGPGVPPELLPRLSERFFRAPGTSEEGSGLGLAIVQRIAERHHAEVIYQLGEERGLCVEVRFPPPRVRDGAAPHPDTPPTR